MRLTSLSLRRCLPNKPDFAFLVEAATQTPAAVEYPAFFARYLIEPGGAGLAKGV